MIASDGKIFMNLECSVFNLFVVCEGDVMFYSSNSVKKIYFSDK